MKKNSYFATNNEQQNLYGLVTITVESIADKISKKRWLALDTETSGLSAFNDRLLMLQIYDGTDTYIIDCQSVDISPLKAVLEDVSITQLYHNAKFDIKFLRMAGINVGRVYDTMLVDKIIHCGKNMKFGLKDLLFRYFDEEMVKAVRSTFIGHKGVFTKAQVLYGIDDVLRLFDIAKLQKPQIDKLELVTIVDLELKALLVYADIEYNGLYLDKEQWTKVAERVYKDLHKHFYDMDMMLYERHPIHRNLQIDMFGTSRSVTLNWDSPLQVLNLFKAKYKNLEGVGADALKDLKDPMVKLYMRYKELRKLHNAYGPDFYKYIHNDGRVHTNFNQVLTTGRVSCSSPNMQQIPSDNLYRNSFKPQDSDYVIVSSDFGAQELGVIAFGSQDPVWLEVLKSGGDLHSRCAEEVFGSKWTSLSPDPAERKNTAEGKKLRTHVKTISFGLCYGMGPRALGGQLGVSNKVAKQLIERYFSVFPRIKAFLDRAGAYGTDNGFIKTFKPFSRVRHFDEWGWDMDSETKGKIRRWSMNTPIQGSAADQCKLALVNLREHIIKTGVRAKIVLTVHDEINCECHRDDATIFAKDLGRIMEEAANTNVPGGLIKCDVTIADVWTK